MSELVGVDVGGTFTDFVHVRDGHVRVLKIATSVPDRSLAVLQGLEVLGVASDALVVHGSTVATNALLERRGAKTALIATRGFADLLVLARQNRPELYSLFQTRDAPLVPKPLRFEVNERVDAAGEAVIALSDTEVSRVGDAIAKAVEEAHVESVAVVLLFAFARPAHERRVAEHLRRRFPHLFITTGLELLPEYREYERTATTVANAYVGPPVARYLMRLIDAMDARTLRVMQSNGGAVPAAQAAAEAARLVLSGPAGGVVGAFQTGRRAGATHVLSFDMGGTSTDVALCLGQIPLTAESQIAGLPIRLPAIDIHTVGAGGGSLARVDAAGGLRVGPESAGSNPGPACYGRGGTEPTVTDAHVVLGRITADRSLGGVAIDPVAAERAVGQIAARLGLSVEDTARGVLRLANATMERALRRVSVERGEDPRACLMVPFGGAGPLHACALAGLLGIREILIPEHPGVLSAVGLLAADEVHERTESAIGTMEQWLAAPDRLGAIAERARTDVLRRFGAPGWKAELELEMRYVGQSYELTVPISIPVSASSLTAAAASFHEQHVHRYGFSNDAAPVETVLLRVRGRLPGPPIEWEAVEDEPVHSAGTTSVGLDDGSTVEIPVIHRSELRAGTPRSGPLLIVQYDTTTLVESDWTARAEDEGRLRLTRDGN